ncbi:MAG: ThiF family adenylyltransferase [bacterium]|nr:ThiF family adenylyltransferase [bacterium]
MTWDRVERLIGKENLQRLAGKRVGVVGLGSGGGFVAVSLAMSGVGNFVLIDEDVLEEANIVRHVADKREVGRAKAEAVADLILQRNPNAYVEARTGRIEAHLDVLDSLDVLIVGVDGEQAKYIINQACLERDLVAIYAGVYERGEGGDVVAIHPYNGPCYACWAAELREGLTITNTAGELDYGMIGPEGTLEAEPALWLHVVRVAAAQADFALKFLLQEANLYEPLPGNTLILANAPLEIIEGEITPPHSALWFTVGRDPACLVCGDQVRAGEAVQGEELSLDQLMSDNALTVEDESSPSARQDT